MITKIHISIFRKLPEASHNHSHDHDISFEKLSETSHNHSHDHDNDRHEKRNRSVMIMTDRHHHSHDHDPVADLLHFWVIATALFTFITPPMAIFFYVGINKSHSSTGEVRGS